MLSVLKTMCTVGSAPGMCAPYTMTYRHRKWHRELNPKWPHVSIQECSHCVLSMYISGNLHYTVYTYMVVHVHVAFMSCTCAYNNYDEHVIVMLCLVWWSHQGDVTRSSLSASSLFVVALTGTRYSFWDVMPSGSSLTGEECQSVLPSMYVMTIMQSIFLYHTL